MQRRKPGRRSPEHISSPPPGGNACREGGDIQGNELGPKNTLDIICQFHEIVRSEMSNNVNFALKNRWEGERTTGVL